MKLDDYRKTISWGQAIEVGRQVVRLSDELPEMEIDGLGATLQRLVNDLPTAIGRDLVTGSQTRQDVFIQIQAALAVVDAIYPALDGAAVEASLQTLIDHCSNPETFAELVSVPAPAAPEEDLEVATEGDTDQDESDV